MIDLTQTPKRLKQSILMEAMQGKLTKQLPSDGDASDLLKKFQQKKHELIKVGKIRRHKKLSPINKNKIPFKIPRNWKWVKLGNISVINTGTTPSKKYRQNDGTGYMPFVTPRDLSNNIVLHTRRILPKHASVKSRFALPHSIFVVGIGTIGKTGIALNKEAFNQQIHNINSFNIDVNNYIFYWLQSNVAKDQFKIGGTVISIVNKTKFSNFIVPVPPLAEQKRIVQRLDQILPKIDDLNQDVIRLHSIRKAFPHRLKQSLLMEAMQGKLTKQLPGDGNADELLQKIQQKKQALIRAGKIRRHKKLPPINEDEIPFKIPKNWKWARLGYDVGGNTPSKHNPQNWNKNGVPWLSVKDINNKYKHNSKEHISVEASKDSARMIPPYSFIAVVRMAIGEYTINTVPLAINQDLRALIFPKYLLRWISSIYSNLKFQGKGATVKGITKEQLLDKIIPLPPLTEQKRISNKLHEFGL